MRTFWLCALTFAAPAYLAAQDIPKADIPTYLAAVDSMAFLPGHRLAEHLAHLTPPSVLDSLHGALVARARVTDALEGQYLSLIGDSPGFCANIDAPQCGAPDLRNDFQSVKVRERLQVARSRYLRTRHAMAVQVASATPDAASP